MSPYTQFMVLTPSSAGKVMTVHGVSSEEARAGNYGLIPRILTPIYILIEELTLRKADRLILVNENKTAWIRSHFGDRMLAKTVVVQNGVDLAGVKSAKADAKGVQNSRMKMGAAEDDFLLFMAKGFVTINGHEYLVRALPLMKARGLKVHLALAGDGTLHPVMKALAAELGVTNDITFMGTITNSEALSAEAAADAIVLPSIRTGSTEEGSSIFLLESMAMAKPIVATSVGGNLTCIQDGVNGILVAEKDPQAIADAVVNLRNDPELMKRLANSAESDAESKWTWNETAKNVFALYTSLLNEKKPT